MSEVVLRCHNCGSADIEVHESAGNAACVNCGTIIEENTIVSTVEFQESGDRSHVIGQFVSANSSGKPFSSASRSRGRYGFTRDSRDTTLQNAQRVISQVATGLHLPIHYIERAHRLYQLALSKNFLFGRRQIHVVATVLYTICRQEKSPQLLIDFSDMLQVNVYKLGKSFLQFARLLNLNIPMIDPSLYIHRFASQLDLGEKQSAVTTTALRTISHFKKDWISIGRRPDGLCAAAMLIACRAHGFDRMQGEVAKIFRVSGETVKNRLADFRATPAANLTVNEFHNVETLGEPDEEYDPPAFITNRQRADMAGDESASILPTRGRPRKGSQSMKARRKQSAIRNRDLQRRTLYGDMYVELGVDNMEEEVVDDGQARLRHLALMAEAEEVVSGVTKDGKETVFGGWGTKKKSRVMDSHEEWQIDTNALTTAQVDAAVQLVTVTSGADDDQENGDGDSDVDAEEDEYDHAGDRGASSSFSSSSSSSSARAVVPTVVFSTTDDGGGQPVAPNDSELDAYILSDAEKRKKELIWNKMHGNFLEARNKRKENKLAEANDRKHRRSQNVTTRESGRNQSRKKRDASTAEQGGEIRKRSRSRKINEEALNASLT